MPPPISSFPAPPTLNVRGGAVVSLSEDESKIAASVTIGAGGAGTTGNSGIKPDQGSKLENYDTMFVEDVSVFFLRKDL